MRSCGQCTLCCTLCLVSELEKAEGVTCIHCRDGCLIYKDRPKACAAYECAWKREEVPEFMQPTVCGVMIEVYPLMIAVLLAPGYAIHDISTETLFILDQFVLSGLPVIATGQFARLPKGMTKNEAENRLIQTVKEHRT